MTGSPRGSAPGGTGIRRGRRAALLGVGLAASAVLGLALSWYDALPGGWRLRALFGADQSRAAEERATHRAARLAAFEASAGGEVELLLLGSSTVERAGDSFLAAVDRRVANRGIGDEPVAALLERLDSMLGANSSGLVVLYAGSVDARRATGPNGSWRDVDEIVEDTAAVLDRIAAHRDGARTLLLEVLPETRARTPAGDRIPALNRKLLRLADERTDVRYMRTWRPPRVEAGALAGPVAADRLHLNDAGYRTLGNWLAEDPWVRAAVRR